jgi:hypothetical protein
MELTEEGNVRIPFRYITDINQFHTTKSRLAARYICAMTAQLDPRVIFVEMKVCRKYIHVHLYRNKISFRAEPLFNVLVHAHTQKLLKADMPECLLKMFKPPGSNELYRAVKLGVNKEAYYVEIPMNYDYENMKRPFTQELIAAAWHPRRVSKWIAEEIDLEDL